MLSRSRSGVRPVPIVFHFVLAGFPFAYGSAAIKRTDLPIVVDELPGPPDPPVWRSGRDPGFRGNGL
jgi:hypothetical protein